MSEREAKDFLDNSYIVNEPLFEIMLRPLHIKLRIADKLLSRFSLLVGMSISSFVPSLSAQHSSLLVSVDSLLAEIEVSKKNGDIQKVLDQEDELAFQYRIKGELFEAIETYNRIRQITSEHDMDSFYFHSLNNIGSTYHQMEDENRVDSIYAIIKKSKNVPGAIMGAAYYLPAFYAAQRGEYDVGVRGYNRSLEFFRAVKDSSKLPIVLRALGNTYGRQGKSANSLKHYLESIPYYTPGSPNYKYVINAYNSINNIFYRHKNYSQALAYSSKILELQHLLRYDSQKQYYNYLHARNLDALNRHSEADSLYDVSYKYYSEQERDVFGFQNNKLSVELGLLGRSLRQDDLLSASKYLDLLDEGFRNLDSGNQLEEMIDMTQDYTKFKCEFFNRTKNYVALKNELDRLEENLVTNQDLELQNIFHSYSHKYWLSQGNHELALVNHEKSQVLSDSIYRMDQLVLVQDMESRYQKTEQENRIALLSSQNELTELQLLSSGRRNIIFGSALALFFIVSIVLYNLYQRIRKKNRLIQLADNEKTVLLQEIHHRVKNNLQVISSLLALQGKYITDDHALDALRQGQDRVQSMALIHKDLYQSENLKGVNIQDYFEQVVDNLFESYNIAEEDIELELDVSPLMLDIDTMIPLGLVINELVSNSLKHAFENTENGKIKVTLKEKDGILNLEVSDNGKGITSLDDLEGNSFGYELIKAFSNKLKAEIIINNDHGFAINLLIKNYKLAA